MSFLTVGDSFIFSEILLFMYGVKNDTYKNVIASEVVDEIKINRNKNKKECHQESSILWIK